MEGAIVCTHSDLREVNFGDQFGFICDGCTKMGYGTCYTCSNASCDYHLHSACKTAPPTMSHPFFANQGIFVLEKTILAPPPPPPPPPPSPYYSSYNPHNCYSHQGLQANFMCVACGTSVAHGWRYVLMSVNGVRTNVFLHPCCMTLPHQNFVQPKLENHPYIYHNNVPNHGYTMTQERGLGGQERQAGNHPRRSNGAIVLGTLNSLTNFVGFANNMGLFDQDFW